MKLRVALLGAFAYVLLVVIIALEVPLVLNISRRVDAEIKAESSGQAQLIATTAADELNRRAALQRLVERSGKALGGRVLIVDSRGRVIVDSAGNGLRGADYSTRPEVSQGLTGVNSQGRRQSTQLDEELLFTAVPIVRRGDTVGVVRVTQSVAAVDDEVRKDSLVLVGVGAGALVLGLGVAWLLAGFLTRPLGRLTGAAREVSGGDLSARAPVSGPAEQRVLAETFNEMTARLEAALEAQRDFVANASHQLRTPLTGLRLRLEAAAGQSSEPEVAEELASAEVEVQRLTDLLNKLLVLAREGQRAPEPEPVDIAECVDGAAERWRVEASERGHRLVVERADQAVAASSAEELGIVLDNLIENAIKYSPPGGAVILEWGEEAGVATPARAPSEVWVWLSVSDEGPGLSDEEAGAALSRFYRGSSAAGEPGTGLGLAIVEALVKRWGGSVELKRRPIDGLQARVVLPAASPNRALTNPLPDDA
ncbi:HAMP domain-containing sensor histidine kinase [soil metagenome]